MQQSQSVREIRERTIGLVKAARSGVSVLSNVIGSIRSNVDLSDEGRQKQIARAIEEARPRILEFLSAARLEVYAGRNNAERVLWRLREVAPEKMATRASILAPVLNSASERPSGLMNAYRRRFHDLVDRRLLEESAEFVIDALDGSDGGRFQQDWGLLRAELAAGLPAEELQAESDLDALNDLSAYLDAAEQVVNFGLNDLDPEVEVSAAARIGVERAVAELNRYESENASALVDLTSS